MKYRIWTLFLAVLFSIMLIFSGCGSKESISALPSEKTSILEKEDESIDKAETEEQKEINIVNQEGEEGSENKEQKTLEPNSLETKSNKIKPNTSVSQKKKEETKAEEKIKKDTKDAKSQKAMATISIVGPEDVGTILKTTNVEIYKDDSVLDLLEKVAAEKNIHLDYKGAGITAYVRGIHNIYEFDRGVKSGWLYRVNGKIPGEGVGTYIVKDGDQIQWIYTIDLGKEL